MARSSSGRRTNTVSIAVQVPRSLAPALARRSLDLRAPSVRPQTKRTVPLSPVRRKNYVPIRVAIRVPKKSHKPTKLQRTYAMARPGRLAIYGAATADKLWLKETNRLRYSEHKQRGSKNVFGGQSASLRRDPHGIYANAVARGYPARKLERIAAVVRAINRKGKR